MTAGEFRSLALEQPEAVEAGHMGKADFRVRGKIFATLDGTAGVGTLKLAPEEQDAFLAIFPGARPAAGAWGARGWTRLDLSGAGAGALSGWMTSAWAGVAPGTLTRTHQIREHR